MLIFFECMSDRPTESMFNFSKGKGGPTQSPLMICSSVCTHDTPILFALCAALPPLHFPATSVFSYLFFWEHYLPAVKTGEIAFPILLFSSVMGLSCKGSVGRGRKVVFPESPLSLDMMTSTREEETFNNVAECLHSSVPCGHHRHRHTFCNDPQFNELLWKWDYFTCSV